MDGPIAGDEGVDVVINVRREKPARRYNGGSSSGSRRRRRKLKGSHDENRLRHRGDEGDNLRSDSAESRGHAHIKRAAIFGKEKSQTSAQILLAVIISGLNF
jgi:hypothetical protein